MPGLVLGFAVLVALLIVGSDAQHIWVALKALTFSEKGSALSAYYQIAASRLQLVLPYAPFMIAALIAGLLEGLHWRYRQTWRGFHRNLWQLSRAPFLLSLTLILGFALTQYQPGATRIWVTCGLLAITTFCLSAGYKAASTR